MYDLRDFEPYTLRKYLGQEPVSGEPVLAWSRKNGYHFLTEHERFMASANEEPFKILGVLK